MKTKILSKILLLLILLSSFANAEEQFDMVRYIKGDTDVKYAHAAETSDDLSSWSLFIAGTCYYVEQLIY